MTYRWQPAILLMYYTLTLPNFIVRCIFLYSHFSRDYCRKIRAKPPPKKLHKVHLWLSYVAQKQMATYRWQPAILLMYLIPWSYQILLFGVFSYIHIFLQTIARKLGRNHYQRLHKIHLWLSYVAQKHRRLSSLMWKVYF